MHPEDLRYPILLWLCGFFTGAGAMLFLVVQWVYWLGKKARRRQAP